MPASCCFPLLTHTPAPLRRVPAAFLGAPWGVRPCDDRLCFLVELWRTTGELAIAASLDAAGDTALCACVAPTCSTASLLGGCLGASCPPPFPCGLVPLCFCATVVTSAVDSHRAAACLCGGRVFSHCASTDLTSCGCLLISLFCLGRSLRPSLFVVRRCGKRRLALSFAVLIICALPSSQGSSVG